MGTAQGHDEINNEGPSARRRSGTFAPFLALLLVGFSIHLLVHQLNIVLLGGFPLGFYLAAQGAPIMLAVIVFWIAARRERAHMGLRTSSVVAEVSGGAWALPLYGLAAAGAFATGGVAVGFTGALFAQGYDALSYVLGLMCGLVVIALFVVPARAATPLGTIAGGVSQRFGSPLTSVLCAVCVGVCLLLLLAAEVSVLNVIFVRWLGIARMDAALLSGAAIALAGVVVLLFRGSLSALRAMVLGFFLIVLCGVAVLASSAHFGMPVAHVGYGDALTQISGLERALLVKGLADPVTLTQHVRPRMNIDTVNFFAIVLCFAIGFSALPLHGLFRGFGARPRAMTKPMPQVSRAVFVSLALAWCALFVCVAVVTLPAVAAFGKLDLYSVIRDGVPLSTLPRWVAYFAWGDLVQICGQTDLAVANLVTSCAHEQSQLALHHVALDRDAILIAIPEIGSRPGGIAMLFAGTLALLAIVAGGATMMTLAVEFADTVSALRGLKPNNEQAPARSTIFYLAIFLTLIVASVAIATLLHPGSLSLVSWAVSLAASTIFPALVIGHFWPRVSGAAVTASIICGFSVCAYYIIGSAFFAPSFAVAWQTISSAPEWQITQLASMDAACRSNDSAACARLFEVAGDSANWFGILNHASAVFALPVAVLVLVLGTLLFPKYNQQDKI